MAVGGPLLVPDSERLLRKTCRRKYLNLGRSTAFSTGTDLANFKEPADTMIRRLIILSLPAAFIALPACESEENTPMRERLALALDDAELSLADAIEVAETAMPGAIVVEAEIDVEDDGTIYDVELYVDGVRHELEIDPDTGTVLDSESEEEAEDEAGEDEVAARESIGWPALIAAAEAEVGGVAFEGKTEGGDNKFEIEVLTDDGVYEVDLDGSGEVLEVEAEDDDEWEDEEDAEDAEDEDDEDLEDETEDADEGE